MASEFPTAWHRERYIADLEREVEGAKRRVAELQAMPGASPRAHEEAAAALTRLRTLGKYLARAAARGPRTSRNALAEASGSSASASFADELVQVDLGGEVLLDRRQSIVMRGRPGRRRVLVIADERMSVSKVAADLYGLAERLVEIA